MSTKRIFDEIMCARGTIIIPDFQRRYVWSTEQCEAFFEKFVMYTKKNIVDYIGNIFFLEDRTYRTSSDIQYIIYDGQQRITTLRIFLYAMLVIARENNILPIENIRGDYFFKLSTIKFENGDQDDFNELHNYIKAQLETTQINTALNEITKTSKRRTPASNNNFVANYNFFYSQLEEIINDGREELFKKIFQAFKFITVIAISNDTESKDLPLKYKIFDALNSSGLKLNIKDIINSEIETSENTYLKKKWEILELQCQDINLAGKDEFNATILNYLKLLGYRLTNVSPLYYFREEIEKEAAVIADSDKQKAYCNVIDNIYRYSSFNYIMKSARSSMKYEFANCFKDILFEEDFKYIEGNEELRYWLPFYIECFDFENAQVAQYLFINYITKSLSFKEFCLCLHCLWCVTVRNLIANNYAKGDKPEDKLNANHKFYTKALGPRIDKSKEHSSFCEEFLSRCNDYLLDEVNNTDIDQLITNLNANFKYKPVNTIHKGRFKKAKANFNGFCLHIIEALENHKNIFNAHKTVAKLFTAKADFSNSNKESPNQLGNLFLTNAVNVVNKTKRNPNLIFDRFKELDDGKFQSVDLLNSNEELLSFVEQRERNLMFKLLESTKLPLQITQVHESNDIPQFLKKLDKNND